MARQSPVLLGLVTVVLVSRVAPAEDESPPAPPDLQVVERIHDDGGVSLVRFVRERGVKVVARPNGRGTEVVADFVVVPLKQRVAGPLDWRGMDDDPLDEESRSRIRKGQAVLVTRAPIPDVYRVLFNDSVVILRLPAK